MSNGGFRRILKHPTPGITWIRNKYNKNLYDKNDTSVPVAHEIFSLNPLPYIPAKIPGESEELRKVFLPTEKAMRKYIQRHDLERQQNGNRNGGDDIMKEEERMAKLLNVDRRSAIGNKSVVLGNAYHFAIRQLDVQRQHPEYSEEEAVAAVEDILRQEDQKERMESRDIAKNIRKHRKEYVKQVHNNIVSPDVNTESESIILTNGSDVGEKKENKTETLPNNEKGAFDMDTIPSILHGDSQTIVELTIWGERLQQVPYDRWTLGAATALDHWIATKILKLKEQTWLDLLQGKEEMGMSRVRDIITVRKTLFPETTLFSTLEDSQDENALDSSYGDVDQRIDDLLASLKFDDEDENGSVNYKEEDYKWGDSMNSMNGDDEKYQAKLENLLETLQSWRERNAKLPYDKWDDFTKSDFETFFNEYLTHLTPESELKHIDMDETRASLLNQPALSRDESNTFFSKLVDETEAEIFLNQLRSSYSNTNASTDDNDPIKRIYETFMSLPHEEQLAKLVTIGTLRPLYDEYVTEKERTQFLVDYEDVLLRGVPMESIVEDDKGPIVLDGLDKELFGESSVSDNVKSEKKTRYRLEKVPYGEANAKREEMILEAWGSYKSAKAVYEEKLFKEGKLGLEYEDNHKEDEDSEKNE